MANSPKICTAGLEKRRVLYFYLHVIGGKPVYNEYEYRFLDTVCRNYQVTVVFFAQSENVSHLTGVFPSSAQLMPVRELTLPTHVPTLMRLIVENLGRILKTALIVRTTKPDLVCGNWITRSSGFYCALSFFHPFLAVAWGSDVLIEAKRSPILRILGRVTMRAADAVIVDSEIQCRAVLQLGCKPSKIYSFPWGIDLQRFKPEKSTEARDRLGWSNQKIVLSTRKHLPVYGVEYLLRAIQLMKPAKGTKFIIAGDGPLLTRHKSLAKELGIEDDVRFLGWVPNEELPMFLNAASIYVSTSFSDGASASLMEAIACGLPVVVTDIPANREWITDGENGLLVPPGDSTALATAITRALKDPELRARMRLANLKLAQERADWNRNLKTLERCISDLLANVNCRTS